MIFFMILILTNSCLAQQLFVYGKVYDSEFPSIQLQQLMVVNQQSQIGIFGGKIGRAHV